MLTIALLNNESHIINLLIDNYEKKVNDEVYLSKIESANDIISKIVDLCNSTADKNKDTFSLNYTKETAYNFLINTSFYIMLYLQIKLSSEFEVDFESLFKSAKMKVDKYNELNKSDSLDELLYHPFKLIVEATLKLQNGGNPDLNMFAMALALNAFILQKKFTNYLPDTICDNVMEGTNDKEPLRTDQKS